MAAIALALGTLHAPVVAAQPTITAEVDRTDISVDQTVLLTIRVTAAGDEVQPELPAFDGFDVVGTSTSRQISISNGAVTSQTTIQLQLRPRALGHLTIPPITVESGGVTRATEPIGITVTPGRAAPTPVAPGAGPGGIPGAPGAPPGGIPGAPGASPGIVPGPLPGGTPGVDSGAGRGERAFVTSEVDRARPYVGQAVVYTFRLYRDPTLGMRGQPRYVEPDFAGFWNKYPPEQTHSSATIGGRFYDVAELRTVLFPTAAGPVEIAPGKLVLRAVFGRAELASEPVALEVRPLPAGAPAGFDGAVGRYEIAAAVDTPNARVDEPLTLTVSIVGEGNLDALPEPAWPELPAGWRAFPGQTTSDTRVESGRVVGSRRIERLLVADRPGDVTLAAVPFAYFDPVAEAYRTVETSPIPVTIAAAEEGGAAPGSSTGAGPSDGGPNAAAPEASFETTASTLPPLKPVASAWTAAGIARGASPALAAMLWAVPLAALGLDAARRRVGARRRPGPDRFEAARRHLAAPGTDGWAAASAAVYAAAEAVVGAPVAGLPRRSIGARLSDAGADDALVARVDTLLAACEAARYDPAAAGRVEPARAAAAVTAAEAVVAALEALSGR